MLYRNFCFYTSCSIAKHQTSHFSSPCFLFSLYVVSRSLLWHIYYPRLSLDVYQFVSLMSVRSTGRGHRTSHGVTTIWPATTHTNTQKHTSNRSTLTAAQTHIFPLWILLPLLSNYILPVSLKCWSRKKGDQECQKKGRRKSLSEKSQIFPPKNEVNKKEKDKLHLKTAPVQTEVGIKNKIK